MMFQMFEFEGRSVNRYVYLFEVKAKEAHDGNL